MAKQDSFVEQSQFRSPHFENGVYGLGDLWNCRNSQSVGHNLFLPAHFSRDNLEARPIKTCDYKLTHVKNELETAKTLKVEGHLSLDLLLKNITLEGNFLCRNNETHRENIEVINCTYINESYRVDLIPSVDGIVNSHILKKICDKEIEATHVVGGVIVGAMVSALIEIKEKDSNSGDQASGSGGVSIGKGSVNSSKTAEAWLKKLIGGFSGELKANWERSEVNAQLDISVTCKAQPMPENLPAPSSVIKLFELIEKIPSAMLKEKHFPMLGRDDITGVPVQFILYPISHFVNLETELCYKQLEDDLLNEFQETISKALDIQKQGYIKNLMLEQDSELKWLLNQKSRLSEKVREYENQLRKVGQRFVKLCRKTLKDYKYNRCKSEDLAQIVTEFNDSEADSINESVEKFVDEGRSEMLKSKAVDGSSKIRRFTVKLELKKWLQSSSKTKALLEIKSPCPSTVVQTFNELANQLTAMGIEMGMVMPSISKEARLHLVCGQRELDFKDTEMREALKILHANLCPGNQTRAIFYRIIAELNGIKFPMQISPEQDWDRTLHKFVKVLSDYGTFYIAESTADFHNYVINLPESTMAFCVPVDAPETALDFLISWKGSRLRSLDGVKWVVFTSDFAKSQEAPLLMVFCDGHLHAVCFDQLELLVLNHLIKSAQIAHVSDVDFSMFSVSQLQNSLHPERASYAYRALNRMTPNTFLDAFQQSERLTVNPDVEELLAIITSCLSSDVLLIISNVAQMALTVFPALSETLNKCGWNASSKTFDPSMFSSSQRSQLVSELEKWATDGSLVQELEKAEKLLIYPQNLHLPNETKLTVIPIVNHSHCPVTYRRRLTEKCAGDLRKHALRELRDMRSKIESTESDSIFFHVAALKSALISSCEACEQESLNDLTQVIIKEYCRKVRWVVPGCSPKVESHIENNQLYSLLRYLSIYKYEKWQFVLYDGLRRLSGLDDSTSLSGLIHELTEACMEEHTEKLWKNDKWLFLIRTCVNATENNAVLGKINEWQQRVPKTKIFPDDIRQKLIGEFPIHTENISTISDFKRFLKAIAANNEDTPCKFTDVLTKALKQNSSLEYELLQAGVLVRWNAELQVFSKEWSLDEIRMAISKIDDALRLPQVNSGSASHATTGFCVDLKVSFLKLDQKEIPCSEPIDPSFRHVMGQTLSRISDTEYLTVRPLSDHPHMHQFGSTALLSVMPYIIQQIKLWDGNIMKVSRISRILTNDEDQANMNCEEQSVNRLDCFAYIVNAANCLVAEEIFRVLSKFPLPLPLIVPDVTKNHKFIITSPLLKNLVIRWETNQQLLVNSRNEDPSIAAQSSVDQSKIVENNLFSSPFRMVVAVRLGTNKTGKSQILNQMMAYPYFFSSRAEADDKCGPPCTLNGTVEFTWLTEETCSDWLWTYLLKSHYANKDDEIVLVANLHGDVTQFPETLCYLKELACCFIVFIMPDCDPDQWEQFKLKVVDKPINFIKIDCNDRKAISTSNLTHKETQDKLRVRINWALKQTLNQRNSTDACQTELHVGQSLRYAEDVKTVESEKTTQLLNSHKCCEIKESIDDMVKNGYDGWKRSVALQELVFSVLNIFNCCVGSDLKKAMIHLEAELTKKSATESINSRRNFVKTQRKLQLARLDIKDSSRTDASAMSSVEQLNEWMMAEMGRVNDANLGLEHIFRTFGMIYHIALGHNSTDKCDVLNLSKYYADLVIKGLAVEILNGDTGEIPLDWFRAICENICERLPNLRVFVISILGLQSSGKSTLLNALFSCRFAVSVGRCSRGLYMRMIFLEEGLRKEHGYDAIILIDTEGLASPEKMNDPDANRKDRLLATFAMGLSNLTIVNVLGEELTKMTEILQIVIVTMARLREADVKPEMLVVQHLQERNPSKLDAAKRQFIDAIKRAFDLVHKSDVELGATQNACLTELIYGIEHKDMFLQFSSFKDGSSVHAPPSESYHTDVAKLYQILLNRARDSTCILSFQRWFQLTESYWNSVTQEKFALNFKSAQHITEFLYYRQKVAKIKDAVGHAFRFHRDIINKNIDEQGKKLEDLRHKITEEMIIELKRIPHGCPKQCDSCKSAFQMQRELLLEVRSTDWELDLNKTIEKCIKNKQNSELKILKQMLEVSILQNGCFSAIPHLIKKELKDELRKKPNGKFTEEEKTNISARVWNLVKEIVSSRETGAPLMEEIEIAIRAEYGNTHPEICTDIKRELKDNTLESRLSKQSALNSFLDQNHPLSENKRLLLIEKVRNFVSNLLTSVNLQCFEVGMKFEAGMITSINRKIPEMLQSYEMESNVRLLQEYKYTVILYVLSEFVKEMKRLQDKWDEQNKPSIILLRMKNLYEEEIKTRLEHGFPLHPMGM